MRMLRLRSALAALAAVTVLGTAACDLSTTAGPQDVEPADLVYAPALNVDFTQMTLTPEGVYYRDLEVGTGAPIVAGDSIMARYKLWLPNGTLVEQNQSVTGVKLELNTLIPGWRVGIPGMKEGGTRQLVIRPSLGYGSAPNQGIPPNSVLVFEVTVVKKLLPTQD